MLDLWLLAPDIEATLLGLEAAAGTNPREEVANATSTCSQALVDLRDLILRVPPPMDRGS
jgi:hypothetical protein